MNPKIPTKRIFAFLLGTSLNAMGISLITKAYLGTSPLSSIPFVLSLGLLPSFGTFTFLLNMLFLVMQILLLRRAFPRHQLLQIPVTIIFGLLIDLFMYLFRHIRPEHYLSSLILLILGCCVMAMGISLSIRARLVATPGDSLVQTISRCTNRRFGNIKIAMDCLMSSVAVFCSFALFHTFRGVREGTLISALLVGAFINLLQRLFPPQEAASDDAAYAG